MANVGGVGGSNHSDWSAADQSSTTENPAADEARPQGNAFTPQEFAELGRQVGIGLSRPTTGEGFEVGAYTVEGLVQLPGTDGDPAPGARITIRYNAMLPKRADSVLLVDTELDGER